MPAFPDTRTLLLTAALIAFGALGGAMAAWAHLPMPWMLGALGASALAVIAFQDGPLRGYHFPNPLRITFIALIGVMIGTQASPELLRDLAALPVALAGILVFILVAHGGNTLIFHKLGGYDRATAFFSGTPGGLLESIALGEEAGADVRILTLQQFLRIIFVVTLVPTALSIWIGAPVGSAAGVAPNGGIPPETKDFVLMAIAAAAGLAMARVIHMPAGHIIGPLLITAGFSLAGVIELHLPFWPIAVAQVVVGTSLGLRFLGITASHIRRGVVLSALSVAFMLIVGALLSLALARLTGMELMQLLLSFAPGGVTEMSLIALSLAVNPALVSLFHVLRILMTVGTLALTARWFGLAGPRG